MIPTRSGPTAMILAEPPCLYLAGPDVFLREAAALRDAKLALCREHGFAGLHPGEGGADASPAIYRDCLAMMRRADAGLFNLTPFRGPSADVGTVFELGFMAAAGKPVFAYSNDGRDLIDRLRPGLTRDGEAWRDASGCLAEDFGNADNLMLDETLALQGRRIHRFAAPGALRFTALDGFRACLDEARRHFAVPDA